jgi:alkanesulfonate monooxygenase SsuD/methylene tetrahydromethanopterin reductase-like flavin-dependent oxidoreductase (luciferase family)
MRFGICTDQNLPFETLVERWRYFEDLGFDSAWDCDHFTQPSQPDGPYFEGWTLLIQLPARATNALQALPRPITEEPLFSSGFLRWT